MGQPSLWDPPQVFRLCVLWCFSLIFFFPFVHEEGVQWVIFKTSLSPRYTHLIFDKQLNALDLMCLVRMA